MHLILGTTPYVSLADYYTLFKNAGFLAADSKNIEHEYELAISNNEQSVNFDAVLPAQSCMQANDTPSVMIVANNSANTLFLNFCKKTYPEASFLLLYSLPEIALAKAIGHGTEPLQFIADWKAAARQLLLFQRHNRKRVALVDGEAALTYPTKLLDTCAKIIGIPFQSVDESLTLPPTFANSLELWLARELLANDNEIAELIIELEVSALPIGKKAALEPLSFVNIASEYQTSLHQLERLRLQNKNSTTQLTESQSYLNKSAHKIDDLSKQLAKTKKDFEKTTQELATINARFIAERNFKNEITQENELLLLQLHQAQEELEAVYLSNHNHLADLNQEKEALTKKLSESQNHKEKYQLDINRLNQEKEALTKKLSESQNHKEKYQLDINRLNQEKEALTKKLSESQNHKEKYQLDINRLNQEKEALTKKLSESQNHKEKYQLDINHLSTQLTNVTNESSALKAKLNVKAEIEHENELLLLQLHQVQEELEQYFTLQKKTTGSHTVIKHKLPEEDLLSPQQRKLLYKKASKDKIKELFSESWYQSFAGKRFGAINHYLRFGWKKKFSPHPLFDPVFYIEANGLANLTTCPLTHFVAFGNALEYSPHPLFNSKWYLAEYPDVKESGINPLLHYLKFGAKEGRNPSPTFNTFYYLSKYPDVRASEMNPLIHYILLGKNEQRNTNGRV